MPGVLTWILQQLTDVQHSTASSEIGIENPLTISSIVKVSYLPQPIQTKFRGYSVFRKHCSHLSDHSHF